MSASKISRRADVDARRQGRNGETFYVSKLGDNTDGRSWDTAFNTVQAALSVVPNDQGGHTIVIRPDTYMEANLFTAHRGAQNAYNLLIGDVKGHLGSGTTGHVIIDSGDPAKGFKSYDWWGSLKSNQQGWSDEHTDPSFSAIGWDRWILRHLYVTGGDGGLMWDCVDKIEPFTVIVEDCVSIGRAFGGGVASCLSRSDEPILFRRCHLFALDWWGDTAAAYVRVENPTMPDRPDIFFEDCTMVSPQCALKAGNYGFTTFSHVAVKNSRLIALNFSQPHGTPTDGIIQSVEHGRYLHVDLENSTLMGFKPFGSAVAKESADEIQYTTHGAVQAYVQFTQEVPDGIHRLGHWPADIFQTLLPPAPHQRPSSPTREDFLREDLCELSPLIWKGRLCHLECVRPGGQGEASEYYLLLKDAGNGAELARFAEGYGLASAHVHDDVLYAFASRWENRTWNDVTLFQSSDLSHWEVDKVIDQEGDEHLFNSSVCQGPDGFVMAYESSDPTYPAFTTKFARSSDLLHWEKIPQAVFGTNRYTACPCIRHADGYYYMLYLENRSPRHFFETYITRSSDLLHWETSAANPVLRPEGTDEGINASDPEIVEVDGSTYLYFAVGDQLTWMNIKRAPYPGSAQSFFESWYAQPGIPDPGTAAADQRNRLTFPRQMQTMVSIKDFPFDADEIERRKQFIRDLWAGRPVDHIPVLMSVANPASRYSIRQQFQDGDKQLEEALTVAGLTWREIPEGDVIPAMRPDVGCSCLATAFGAELYWGDDPNQTCGVKNPLLKDVEEAYDLPVPTPTSGQLAEGIARIKQFADAGEGLVSVSLLDMAGGLNVVCDLLGGEGMYLAMHDNPDALLHLLDKIQQLFLDTVELQIEAAGGQERITTIDFPDYWFPEGRKGHASDDISAAISPEQYRKFSLPFHDRIFSRYGGGGLHNCGPNPCLEDYLRHTPAPRAIDLSFRYSQVDLPAIKEICRKRALIYMGEFPSQPQEALDTFREVMEFMTPDVVVIPVLGVPLDDHPAEFHHAMRVIAEEYAQRMDWGWTC